MLGCSLSSVCQTFSTLPEFQTWAPPAESAGASSSETWRSPAHPSSLDPNNKEEEFLPLLLFTKLIKKKWFFYNSSIPLPSRHHLSFWTDICVSFIELCEQSMFFTIFGCAKIWSLGICILAPPRQGSKAHHNRRPLCQKVTAAEWWEWAPTWSLHGCKIWKCFLFTSFLWESVVTNNCSTNQKTKQKLYLSINPTPADFEPNCRKQTGKTLHLFCELEGAGRFQRWWGSCPGCAWLWSGLWRQSCPCASCRTARSTPWTLRAREWAGERGYIGAPGTFSGALTTTLRIKGNPPIPNGHFPCNEWNSRNDYTQDWLLQTGNDVSICLFPPHSV